MRRCNLSILRTGACLLPLLLLRSSPVQAERLTEEERLAEYVARNHTWPPKYFPDTPGWKAIMDRRFDQVSRIENMGERYTAYVETARSGITTPNFTETGWGLTRAPEDLIRALREGIREGLEKGPRLEGRVDVIDGPQAWYIDRPDLTERVLSELKPMHERWSGQKLVKNNAYGFRLYRNQSALHMHVDRSQTHIISCILHIDRSEDSEPWPILIEDLQGNTNEVILESGDILFYESSKCFHGRPKKFVGSWYSSVFVHYYPVGWNLTERGKLGHYAVPPHWADEPVPSDGGDGGPAETDCSDDDGRCGPWAAEGECKNNPRWMLEHCRSSCGRCGTSTAAAGGGGDKVQMVDRLRMEGTGMKEPDCENRWCAFRDGTVKWYGPGEEGMVITTGKKYSLWGDERKVAREAEL